jgi:hypothetical protein
VLSGGKHAARKVKRAQILLAADAEVDGTYVARMEDVLDLYAETPDPKRPVVCFDESPADRRGAPADRDRLARRDLQAQRRRALPIRRRRHRLDGRGPPAKPILDRLQGNPTRE